MSRRVVESEVLKGVRIGRVENVKSRNLIFSSLKNQKTVRILEDFKITSRV